ncbi:hypothetical protein ACLOJK_022676 [Asimina triloba]
MEMTLVGHYTDLTKATMESSNDRVFIRLATSSKAGGRQYPIAIRIPIRDAIRIHHGEQQSDVLRPNMPEAADLSHPISNRIQQKHNLAM